MTYPDGSGSSHFPGMSWNDQDAILKFGSGSEHLAIGEVDTENFRTDTKE